MNAPYIGKSVPRASARRLLQGRGMYTDDLRFARLAHAVFFRSPHARARIVKLDLAKARTLPGVVTVVEETYEFGRHTGVTLEGRAILADYNAAEHTLTVHHSTQTPHMMQDIFSRHLDIPEGNVRVIAKDVGGSFGIKVHVYADEMAAVALAIMLKRPVKFMADRMESFLTDIHAREHKANSSGAALQDVAAAVVVLDVVSFGKKGCMSKTGNVAAVSASAGRPAVTCGAAFLFWLKRALNGIVAT